MEKTKLGAQLYTVRNFLTKKEQILPTFIKVRDAGYNVVQVSGLKNWFDKELIDEITKVSKILKLDICVTHVPFEDLVNNIDYFAKMHQDWNCKYVGIGRIIDQYRNNPSIEGYTSFAKDLNEVASKLSKYDLKLVYHNHEYEFMKIGNKLLIDVLIENTDIENVHYEFDVHWVWRGGCDPVEFLTRMKNRIDVIHLKDYVVYHEGTNLRSEIRFGEIGTGTLDFVKIINAAIKGNCKYMVVEQDDTYGRDPFACLELSHDNLVKLGFEGLF